MEVKDPHKAEITYKRWRENVKRIEGVDNKISSLIIRYLDDLEQGRNIAKGTKKGKRSYTRLKANLSKLKFIFVLLKKRNIKGMEISDSKIVKLFNDMENGVIKKQNGREFKSTSDYARTFTSFWHWWMRINKKNGNLIEDICEDLNTVDKENNFVYFSKEELDKMLRRFTKDEAIMLLFMFDTIIRAPKELSNIRKSDLSEDCTELNIRDEISKTYGRRIKLMLCSESLGNYVKEKQLKENDYLFGFSPPLLNKKLKNVALKLFGDKMTKGGSRFSQISMYDFRHSGAIFWRLGAYHQKIDSLMYRGAWANLRILNYYTKKIGMKDSIEEGDMLSLEDKTKLEKDLEKMKESQKKFAKLFNPFLKVLKKNPDLVKELIKKDGNEIIDLLINK